MPTPHLFSPPLLADLGLYLLEERVVGNRNSTTSTHPVPLAVTMDII